MDGQNVPMTFGPERTGSVVYQANVTRGATYRVRVAQPPFSAVFTFDTSGSMGDYLPFVTEALRAYTGGVTKGDEAVKIIPFEEKPLLPDWSDDPYLLQDAVDRYVHRAAGRAAPRPRSSTPPRSSPVARAPGPCSWSPTPRPAAITGARSCGATSKASARWSSRSTSAATACRRSPLHFMQDWAMAGGGFYQYAVSHGEMDRAFDRMATWLRRPAAYTLDVSTSEVELPPPPPGTLSVVGRRGCRRARPRRP